MKLCRLPTVQQFTGERTFSRRTNEGRRTLRVKLMFHPNKIGLSINPDKIWRHACSYRKRGGKNARNTFTMYCPPYENEHGCGRKAEERRS